MGYSARYHAASLAAVFLALAVGILIGIGFGSDVVTGTAEDLEESLGADLDEANERIAVLESELDRSNEFAQLAFPALVRGELTGDTVGVIGLGGLDEEASTAVRDAVEEAGGAVGQLGVVGEPPDIGAVLGAMRNDRAGALPRGEAFARAARRAGRLLVVGGPRFDAVREAMLDRYTGNPGDTDAVVVLRDRPPDLESREEADTEVLERELITGMRAAGARVIGVERSDAEESSIPFFEEHRLSTVDNVDQIAGRVALVWTLDGAEGSFGIKETADALLPERLPGGDGSR